MKPMAKRNPTKYQQRRRVFLGYLPAAWVAIAFICWGLAWLIKKTPRYRGVVTFRIQSCSWYTCSLNFLPQSMFCTSAFRSASLSFSAG